MSKKLARAQHTHEAVARRLKSGAQPLKSGAHLKSEAKPLKPNNREDTEGTKESKAPSSDIASVSSSAALISVSVLFSRITGFIRTWAMAFALGVTALSSSYQIANNLPSMLYELVVGGMLVTAFLPVYISVKKKLGAEAGNKYASNLLTIVIAFLALITIFSMCFPSLIIFTQSFLSNQEEMSQAVFFFQFFAIQIMFYGISSVLSGLLNANRDYLWSSIAPVANNIIVIATFLLYAAIVPTSPELALYVIAIGNPLGVFVQMVMQIPALKRNGIKLRPRIDFKDPALKETISLGIPALIVMACSFGIVAAQNAAALQFAENGVAILNYSRLWYTLPYAFLAVPITTTLFTELSEMHEENDQKGVKRGILSGTNQILFFMIPFAFYLIVYAFPLNTLYNAGAFTAESVGEVARYLQIFALSLPLYAVNMYLNKVFSSLHRMKTFAYFNTAATVIQIALILFAATNVSLGFPIESIAVAGFIFYALCDICLLTYLRKSLGKLGLSSTLTTCLWSILLGGLGAGAGLGLLNLLELVFGSLSGSISRAFIYVVICGLVSLVVTFGLAIKLKLPETAFLTSIIDRVKGKATRH